MVVGMMENDELLAMLWDDETVTLEGVAGGVASCIDRDQALDDEGGALFDSYRFLLPDGVYVFSADDLESFVRN